MIAPDARGHGESGWAERPEQYDLDHGIGDLCAIVEQLPRSPAIVGASMGGLTALAAVGERDRPFARALVLVDVVPRLSKDGAAAIARFMDATPQGFASIAEGAAAVEAYLPHRPRPTDLAGLKRNLRTGSDDRFHWHWDPAFRVYANSHDRSVDIGRLEMAARHIDVPTLLIRGANSQLVTAAGMDSLLELIPHATCAVIEEAHHMVVGDKNDTFNNIALEFLRDLPCA
jgi:pimeloyl-ACP methyl ester carboxylesterase